MTKIQPQIGACLSELNSNESPVFLFCFAFLAPDPLLSDSYTFGLILFAYSHVPCSVCSPPRHCPDMSQRARTHPPTSTGCTAGHQAATWPRATTTGSRRARLCLTQAAGWACMRGRSIHPWALSTRPEKVLLLFFLFILIISNYFYCLRCWITVLPSLSRTFTQSPLTATAANTSKPHTQL